MLARLLSDLDWLLNSDIVKNVLATLIAAFVVFLVASAYKRALPLFRRGPGYSTGLSKYRNRLSQTLAKLHHPWMKEGQSLQDILVPVSIESSETETRTKDLEAALVAEFTAGRTPRILILGRPGSGKSVALRTIARRTWTLPQTDSTTPKRIPVIFGFSDYRDAGFELPKVIIRALVEHGFRLASEGTADLEEFVTSGLSLGLFVLLVDALDELQLEDRKLAAKRIASDLNANPLTPAFLTCRSAAWNGPVRGHLDAVLGGKWQMADFTPAAIRQFINNWKYKPPKSSHELLQTINSQAHVRDLARNPLMLTIISFLYSQPKYRLPENRAQFYEVCSRALLEEWDQSENPDRANHFDRPHKEYLLGMLAYEHMCSPEPDRDIDESVALEEFSQGMATRGLKKEENSRLLEEVIVNSGILIRLPPAGLRFPHQTLLEYFSALHILRNRSISLLLERYAQDPGRWREVLLLYCGLNDDAEQTSLVLQHLQASGQIEVAVGATIDARSVKANVATQILDAAEQKLRTVPSVELISAYGYLSANPHSSNAGRAADVMRSMLTLVAEGKVAKEFVQSILLAALRKPTEETTQFVVQNAEKLDLRRVLPEMGPDALVVASWVVGQPSLSIAKKLEWIDGLAAAGAIKILLGLIAMPDLAPEVSNAVFLGIARCSNLDGFFDMLDLDEVPEPMPRREISGIFTKWGWPFAKPNTIKAKQILCNTAAVLAKSAATNSLDLSNGKTLHPRLAYLAIALTTPKNSVAIAKLGNDALRPLEKILPAVARSIWLKADKIRWQRWVNRTKGTSQILCFLPSTLLSISILLSGLGQAANLYEVRLPAALGIGLLAYMASVALGVRFVLKEREWSDLVTSLVVPLFVPPWILIGVVSIEALKTKWAALSTVFQWVLLFFGLFVTLLLAIVWGLPEWFVIGVALTAWAIPGVLTFDAPTFPLIASTSTQSLFRVLGESL